MQLVFDGEYLTPKNAEDMPMFSHCAGGMISVTPKHWRSVVVPVLSQHEYFMHSHPTVNGEPWEEWVNRGCPCSPEEWIDIPPFLRKGSD